MAAIDSNKPGTGLLWQRLLPLHRIFAHAAIGDFSQELPIPENDDELAEVYIGVHVMLNVIRQTITELQTTNDNLQKQIEHLAQAKAQDEALLASVGEGMIATDEQGRIIRLNEAGEHILNVKTENVLGKVLSDALMITDATGTPMPVTQRPFWRALHEGQRNSAVNFSMYYHHPDGTQTPLAVTASPIKHGTRIIGTINIFRDLSREKTSHHGKNDFLTVAAHQLRTPLTMINWHTQRLLRTNTDNLSTIQQSCLTDIKAGMTRLNTMFNTLMMVSELQLGTVCATCQRTELIPLLVQLLSSTKEQAQAKTIAINETYATDIPPVESDQRLLLIVLETLLDNAITYTPAHGTVQIETEFIGHRDGTDSPTTSGKVIIKIMDTGIGIPVHQQGNVFTKLFRADNAKTIEPGGTGLNLFVAKGLLELMQGEMWFDSHEGQGTTFFVALPVSGKM